MIEKHLNDELPFMATENILMEAVKKGGNRQTLHEEIRRHSMAAGAVVKVEGKPNDLVERIAADPMFSLTLDEIKAQPDKTYLLVAHNGIARMVKSYFEDMGNEEFSAFKIKNCEILKFEL